ncbi:MAG: hypothetical protein M1140_01120 [Chloroflexi bacterium]|nr:hypothetical protein [Chloroflexota bacterium]
MNKRVGSWLSVRLPADSFLRWLRRLLPYLTVIGIFAIYAPALRLMPLHDDAVIILETLDVSIAKLFLSPPPGIDNYRPFAMMPWLAIRDAFGWYIPACLHFFNIWAHVLNVALVYAVTRRISRLRGNTSLVLPLFSALFFGLFPLSYQAVLWAGALPYPFMAMMGLAAVLAYLFARSTNQPALWVVTGLSLLAACLSHESGFLFGFIILLLDILLVISTRKRSPAAACVLIALTLVYPVVFRLFLNGADYRASRLAPDLSVLSSNLIYFMQGVDSWIIVFLRTKLDLGATAETSVVLIFAIVVAVALFLQWRTRQLFWGLFGLGVWFITVAPSSLLLDPAYIRISPRLMYVSVVGIAIFWGAAVLAVLQLARMQVVRYGLLVTGVILAVWCWGYIADHLNETARLTPAMRLIDADMKRSNPDDTVLLINMPAWNSPTYPAFLIGAEGMPIFQNANIPSWSWLASISGTRRNMTYLRHDISLTRGDHYMYGIGGQTSVNDEVVRASILKSNLIYRFDYDAPGVRAQRLAVIHTGTAGTNPLAVFSDASMSVAINGAHASLCSNNIRFDLTWSDVRGMSQPAGVFVHVLNAANQQVIVADKDLIDGYLPLQLTPSTVVISETRVITVPPGTEALKAIEMGVYLRSDGKRFTAKRANGQPWDGDSVVVPVESRSEDCSHENH